MAAIDGSSRSGPVSVTVAPPKSSVPPSAAVPSVGVESALLESLSSSLPQAAATSDKAIGTAASLSQRLFMWVLPLWWMLPNDFGNVNAYRRDGSTSRTNVLFLSEILDG